MIPVFVLTGFLGSGKTTLLRELLADPRFADTAVVMNEFGEVSIDHDLLRVGGTDMMVTTTGCLCCTAGSDLRSALHDLFVLAREKLSRSFSRVVVETTGLADPAPAVNQLIPGGAPAIGLRDHVVARTFELAGVVTMVDVVTGALSLERYFESLKQVAFADRIVLTKTDLARDPASARDVEELRADLSAIAPTATILDRREVDLTNLFTPRPYVPTSVSSDVDGWLAVERVLAAEKAAQPATPHGSATPARRHDFGIETFTVLRERPVPRAMFDAFLAMLKQSAGPHLLRLKGLVAIEGDDDRPLLVHVVQHALHPPLRLERWPSDDRRTRLVAITHGIDAAAVRNLFDVLAGSDDTRADVGASLVSELPR